MFATLTDHLVSFVDKLLVYKGRLSFKVLKARASLKGITTVLAEKLQRIGNIEYTFTNISPTLVKQARKTFSKFS